MRSFQTRHTILAPTALRSVVQWRLYSLSRDRLAPTPTSQQLKVVRQGPAAQFYIWSVPTVCRQIYQLTQDSYVTLYQDFSMKV